MRIDTISLQIKNGEYFTFLSPTEEHAHDVLNHMKQTSSETEYLLRYEDEIRMTVEEERDFLSKQAENPKAIMISAYFDEKLVALTGISPVVECDKCSHRAVLGMCVLKDFWGKGIGFTIMGMIIDETRKMGYEQVELEVVADNIRAFSLYKKFGFEIYGVRKNSFKYRDGRYSSEYLMALPL